MFVAGVFVFVFFLLFLPTPTTSLRPRPRVIVLARDPAPVTGKVLLAAGVTCLGRAILAEQDLLHAIHRTAHGEPMFLTSDGHRHETPVRLTNRETDVLELLSTGQRYAAIAPPSA